MSDSAQLYPIAGSLADQLSQLSEADFERKYGKPLEAGPTEQPVPVGPVGPFADRVFGLVGSWFLEDWGVVVSPRFPIFAQRPEAVNIAYPWDGRGQPLDLAGTIGLPQPDVDPSHVVGPRGARSISYIPAPLALAELTYTVATTSKGKVHITATALMVDQVRRSELVSQWLKDLPWIGSGTMYFKDLDEARSARGELFPPGAAEMRRLV